MKDEVKEIVDVEEKVVEEKEVFDRESFLKGESTEGEEEEGHENEHQEEEKKVVAVEKEKVVEEEKIEEGQALDSYWETIGKTLSTEDKPYEIPEYIKTGKDKDGKDLSAGDKFNLLTKEILKHSSYSQSPEIDSYVRTLLSNSTQKDFSLDNYIKGFSQQVETRNLPVDERLFLDNKAKYGKKDENDQVGMTDDEIKEEVGKLSKFQKLDAIKVLDEKIDSDRLESIKTNVSEYNNGFDVSFEKVEKEDADLLNDYIKRVEGNTNIDGIELGEADHKTFLKEMPSFFEKKVVTNDDGYKYVTSEVQEQLAGLLESPENSMHLLPLLWMASKGKLQGYTSSIKEATKKKIEEKFISKPKTEKESSVTDEFDRGRFLKGEE